MKTYILTEEELDVLLGNAYHQGFALGKGEPASLSEKACLVMCHGLYDSLYAPEWQERPIPEPNEFQVLILETADQHEGFCSFWYSTTTKEGRIEEWRWPNIKGQPLQEWITSNDQWYSGRWCIQHIAIPATSGSSESQL